jgi:hypothetical protein
MPAETSQSSPPSPQQPIELILARNLISSLDVPAFLVDEHETLLFYNARAGELLRKRFEELGRRSVTAWSAEHFQRGGEPIPAEDLPFVVAVRETRPVHRRLAVQPDGGEHVEIEAAAVPLVGADGCHGAIVVFWRV